MKRPRRQVWFVVFPQSELLDLSGPWAVLGYANEVAGQRLYDIRLVGAAAGEASTRHGIVLGQVAAIDAKGSLPDMLVVVGGAPSLGRSVAELQVARWLRGHRREIRRIVSICTGAFVLGEASLLDGRRATTHWQYRDDLRRRFPKAVVERDDIFLRDGKIWTSAGVTAGVDLMLALVEEDHGRDISMTVAKNLLVFMRRSGQQAQFSDVLKSQTREPARIQGLSAFVLERLQSDISVDSLAQALGMSGRTLSRWCGRELGETPGGLVRRLRLREAQRLLEETSLPLKSVAAQTGLGDESTLWRVFNRYLGVTPAEYRTRFALHRR